jgi:hypothetical protein
MFQQMYINPAIATLILTFLGVLSGAGGVLWYFAGRLGGITTSIEVMSERLNTHIKFCENNCPGIKSGAKRLP